MTAYKANRGLPVNPGQAEDGYLLAPGDKLKAVLKKIKLLAGIDCTVLIEGESGTGKELIAKAIHYHGERRHNPFIAVNCAALNNDLLGSQLFGHLKGAFTGAVSANQGLIKAAEGGTLFLDEISSLGLSAQAQLLRFLESGEVRSVGSSRLCFPRVRVIAASNRPLSDLRADNLFRADLFYRLYEYSIKTVPLRYEPGHVKDFADFFLKQYLRKHGCPGKYFEKPVQDFFRVYQWPGNVRELKSVVFRGVINAGKTRRISLGHLELELNPRESLRVPLEGDLAGVLSRVEYHYLLYQLGLCQGNQQKLIRKSGKSKNYLRNRLKRYSINAASLRTPPS